MKKLLIVAGLVGAFAIGATTAGPIFSYASSNIGADDASSNRMGQNEMMNSDQGSGMANMMGDSSGMGSMGNMNGMMDSMSSMGDMMDNLLNVAAQNLGMTTDQLQNELRSGKSLETISEEKGVKPDKLVKKLEKVVREDVKQFRKDGSLTKEQEKMLLSMRENIGTMLNTNGMFACNGFGK